MHRTTTRSGATIPKSATPMRWSQSSRSSTPPPRAGWHEHPAFVPFKAVGRFIRRSGKRIAVTIAGAVVVLVGVALLVLPGPGWVLIFAGLAILVHRVRLGATAAREGQGEGGPGQGRGLPQEERRRRPAGRLTSPWAGTAAS